MRNVLFLRTGARQLTFAVTKSCQFLGNGTIMSDAFLPIMWCNSVSVDGIDSKLGDFNSRASSSCSIANESLSISHHCKFLGILYPLFFRQFL
jgi:hypothetical protein